MMNTALAFAPTTDNSYSESTEHVYTAYLNMAYDSFINSFELQLDIEMDNDGRVTDVKLTKQ